MKYILIITIFFAGFTAMAQESDISLAYKYYQNNEYEKAAVLFEKLYKKRRNNTYLSYTVNCLVKIKNYDKAEKLLKKEIRRDKKQLSNYVELGYLYKVRGDIDNADKKFNYVLKNIKGNKYDIITTANLFLSKSEFDFANKVYEKGAELMDYKFYMEKANSFSYQRKYQEMIDAYLDYLKEDPKQMQYVQNRLQSKLNNKLEEDITAMLKRSLIARIQKESDFYLYNELLIWLYVQKKNFAQAIIQAKALDRRLKEEGFRLLELGKLALQNDEFSSASESFEYVIKKGKESPFYAEAKQYYLYVLYELVTKGKITKKSEIEDVEKQYIETLKELDNAVRTIRLIKDLAHLQAFYLNKDKEAVELLNEVINKPNTKPLFTGFCKIELGDILTLQDDIPGAIMEYAQAANINKTNEIGDKAKLRRATLAFYMGNFKWAQAQLDVLKTGTSKLIANDAFKLSNLIEDNIDKDSTNEALQYYSRAELLLEQNKEKKAMQTLDSLEKKFNNNSLVDDVLFLKANIYEKSGNLQKAIECLTTISNKYPLDLLGDDAVYKLAQIFDYKLNDEKKAKEYYKKIIFDYPASIYVSDARNRFRYLRENKNNEQ